MGLGDEKIDNVWELGVRVCAEQQDGGDIPRRVTLQSLACRARVIDDDNIVFFF